jgi:hypothetical protein
MSRSVSRACPASERRGRAAAACVPVKTGPLSWAVASGWPQAASRGLPTFSRAGLADGRQTGDYRFLTDNGAGPLACRKGQGAGLVPPAGLKAGEAGQREFGAGPAPD